MHSKIRTYMKFFGYSLEFMLNKVGVGNKKLRFTFIDILSQTISSKVTKIITVIPLRSEKSGILMKWKIVSRQNFAED